MSLSVEFWVQITVYTLSFGMVFGSFRTRLNYMEKKLDKHNSFQDRLVKVEESTKSIHHRLDEINRR